MTADDYAGARALADYRHRIEASWPGVRVAQVDSTPIPDVPQIGLPLGLTAHVQLGDLTPEDVEVQAVVGRVGSDDTIGDPVTVAMEHIGTDPLGEEFTATVPLPLAGAVGYTVRVLPRHGLLASPAELGMVALP